MLNEVAGQIPPTFLFHRGDHRQPKGEIAPGGLTVCAAAGRAAANRARRPDAADLRPPAGAGPLADRRQESAHRPGARQSRVDESFRPRAGQHAGRFRLAGREAFASRAARLAGPRLRGRRLEAQAAAQADHDFDRLSPELGTRRRQGRSSIPRIGCTGGCRCGGSTPRRCAIGFWPTSGVLNRKMFGPPVPVKEDAVGQIVVASTRRRPAPSRRSGTRRFAAASTSRCAAASRWPCCTPSISR